MEGSTENSVEKECSCFQAEEKGCKYEITRTICTETINHVYKVKLLSKDNHEPPLYYVMKIIPESPDEEEMLRELNNLQKFEHENILKSYEYFKVGSSCNNGFCKLPQKVCVEGRYTNSTLMIFEYCNGADLKEKIKKNELTYEDKMEIAKTLTCTLKDLHRANILHRDIKPGNIFFKTNAARKCNIPVLGDFGLSKLCLRAELTQQHTNEMTGTILYVAPEVKTGKREYSSRADSFSWGLTLAELFYSDTNIQYADWNQNYRKVSEENPIEAFDMLVEKFGENLGLVIWGLTMHYSKERYFIKDIDFTEEVYKQLRDYKDKYKNFGANEEILSLKNFLKISSDNMVLANDTYLEKIKGPQLDARKIEKKLNIVKKWAASSKCVQSFNLEDIDIKIEIDNKSDRERLDHLIQRIRETAKYHQGYWKIETIIRNSFSKGINHQYQNFESIKKSVENEMEGCITDKTENLKMVQDLVKYWIEIFTSEEFQKKFPISWTQSVLGRIGLV